MRFVVHGAGAVGGVIGARLFQSGHDVTLIARGRGRPPQRPPQRRGRRLGREHGVPTPVNELLQRPANQMVRERRDPGLMTAEEFIAAVDGR